MLHRPSSVTAHLHTSVGIFADLHAAGREATWVSIAVLLCWVLFAYVRQKMLVPTHAWGGFRGLVLALGLMGLLGRTLPMPPCWASTKTTMEDKAVKASAKRCMMLRER